MRKARREVVQKRWTLGKKVFILPMLDILFVQNGADAFGKLAAEPTRFSVVAARNEILELAANREGERILTIGNRIIVAVGSQINLEYTKSKEGGRSLSAVGKSDGTTTMSQVSGGPNTIDVEGINLFGAVYRSGSVTVTKEGLLFSKGTEVIEMR